MADIKYEFESTYQEECYDKVAGFCKELFGEMARPQDEFPSFRISFGSAVVYVSVRAWGDDDATIAVGSWVITGVEMTPELMEFLIRRNHNMRFGAFSIDDENDIHFEHTIVGSTVDKGELEASIKGVANIADSYDDEIKERFGGNRARD